MKRRGRPRHPDVLTPRQWEVLTLVREGLSNEQIAARLGISLDGVKFHISEILGKLAVSNRNEAARWHEERERAAPSASLRYAGCVRERRLRLARHAHRHDRGAGLRGRSRSAPHVIRIGTRERGRGQDVFDVAAASAVAFAANVRRTP